MIVQNENLQKLLWVTEMQQSLEFLVFGATGQQGGAVARALIARGERYVPSSGMSRAIKQELLPNWASTGCWRSV